MFSVRDHVTDTLPAHLTDWYLSCDYGTVNPCSIGLWGYCPAMPSRRWLSTTSPTALP